MSTGNAMEKEHAQMQHAIASQTCFLQLNVAQTSLNSAVIKETDLVQMFGQGLLVHIAMVQEHAANILPRG